VFRSNSSKHLREYKLRQGGPCIVMSAVTPYCEFALVVFPTVSYLAIMGLPTAVSSTAYVQGTFIV